MTIQLEDYYWKQFAQIVQAVSPEVERLENEKNPSKAKEIVEATQRLYTALQCLYGDYKPEGLNEREIVYYRAVPHCIELEDKKKGTFPPALRVDYLYVKVHKKEKEDSELEKMHSIAGALNISSNNPMNVFGGTRGALFGESDALKKVKERLTSTAQ